MPLCGGCIRTVFRLITVGVIVSAVLHYILALLYGFSLWKGGCLYLCRDKDPLTETIESFLHMIERDIAGMVGSPLLVMFAFAYVAAVLSPDC